MIKLNYLLALTDKMKVTYKNMIKDYTKFFDKGSGAFLGEKQTYQSKEGFVDESNKRKHVLVSTTVDEKFDYFIESIDNFITSLFNQERTNSSGVAKAELIVSNESWGEFTSLELLKLKSLLESSDLGSLTDMLNVIPVRSDKQIWNKSKEDEYKGRKIFETPLEIGEAITTIKETFIMNDPNLSKLTDTKSYQPVPAQRDKVIPKGDYTKQFFSGEWTQRQRAEALRRKDLLLLSVYRALKESNDVDVVESTLTGKKLFNYIFKG